MVQPNTPSKHTLSINRAEEEGKAKERDAEARRAVAAKIKENKGIQFRLVQLNEELIMCESLLERIKTHPSSVADRKILESMPDIAERIKRGREALIGEIPGLEGMEGMPPASRINDMIISMNARIGEHKKQEEAERPSASQDMPPGRTMYKVSRQEQREGETAVRQKKSGNILIKFLTMINTMINRLLLG